MLSLDSLSVEVPKPKIDQECFPNVEIWRSYHKLAIAAQGILAKSKT